MESLLLRGYAPCETKVVKISQISFLSDAYFYVYRVLHGIVDLLVDTCCCCVGMVFSLLC